jgi:hypothetical protein
MKYGNSSYPFDLEDEDYRALFAAAVERNDSVDYQACTVAANQQKLQTTINLPVNTTIHSHGRVREGGGRLGGRNGARSNAPPRRIWSAPWQKRCGWV